MPKSKIMGHDLVFVDDRFLGIEKVLRFCKCQCGLMITGHGRNIREANDQVVVSWNRHLRRMGQVG